MDFICVSSFNVSIKSGKSIQFVLGNIPELKNIDVKELLDENFTRKVFNKYLKKTESKYPSDLLAYKHEEKQRWIFFNMDEVINYIVSRCKWRKLKSGRIKGDFQDNSKKGFRQYLTYEYRKKHKGYFLGLCGGTGIKFIELLMDKKYGIKYFADYFN